MSYKTPLYDIHVGTGAVFHDDNAWTIPAHFGNPLQEYEAAVDHVVRFDLGHHSRIEAVGREAALFLHNLCSSDVKNLAVRAGGEAFLCTNKARAVAHVTLSRFPDVVAGEAVFRMEAIAGQNEKILRHLNHYLISEQVDLSDITESWRQILVAGPAAAATLHELFQVPLDELQPWHLTQASENIFMRRRADLSVPALDLWLPTAAMEETWLQLARVSVTAAGSQCLDILRLEAGTPRYGVDMDEQRFVAEVNRTEQAISYAKGCYLGQEPIVMARDRGQLNRLLLGLSMLDEREPPSAGSKVMQGGVEVGQVTSAAFSPRLGKVIALAYLKRGSWDAGTALTVLTASGPRAAAASAFPFVSP